MHAKRNAQSWAITDDFWARVEPLIPQRRRVADHAYLRKAGAGRPAKSARLVFEAILYVLRTGCSWKALPKDRFGSASAVHQRFLDWERAGVFASLWRAGLAECDAMEGIAWHWQSIDGTMFKEPLAQVIEDHGPAERRDSGKQAPHFGGRIWRPLVPRRHRAQRP